MYIYFVKAYLIQTSSCGSRALLFKRGWKKTPLIYPFICGQTLGEVNGYDSIYTTHATSWGLGKKKQFRTFRKHNPLNHSMKFCGPRTHLDALSTTKVSHEKFENNLKTVIWQQKDSKIWYSQWFKVLHSSKKQIYSDMCLRKNERYFTHVKLKTLLKPFHLLYSKIINIKLIYYHF